MQFAFLVRVFFLRINPRGLKQLCRLTREETFDLPLIDTLPKSETVHAIGTFGDSTLQLIFSAGIKKKKKKKTLSCLGFASFSTSSFPQMPS